jgi:hypothetical protein
MTPKQIKNSDRKRQTYGLVMDTAKKMISAIENSPVRIQKVLESMNDEIKEAETLNNFSTVVPRGCINRAKNRQDQT